MFLIPGLMAIAALAASTQSVAASLEWYTVRGSRNPAFSSGEKVRGVNLGNWFFLENWMKPSLFGISGLPGKDNDTQVMDEWTFCSILGKERCAEVLEKHWDTWITEDDFKRMAGYGLNTVRLSLPYWVYNCSDGEPYVTQKQIPYIQKALNWSSIYGLDVMMDLHALPGSQSSYQIHTGHYTQESFHSDPANADRALDALAKFVDEFTQEKYHGVVKAWELVNEPWVDGSNMPWDYLSGYLDRAYWTVREHEKKNLNGKNESMIIFHDAFQPLQRWKGWFAETSRVDWLNYAIDAHYYEAWSDHDNYGRIASVCSKKNILATAQTWFPTFVGEQSLGVGTFCVHYKECFNLTSQDLMGNYYVYNHGAGFIFWNWKALSPVWSYEDSVARKWIPANLTNVAWQYDPKLEFCLKDYNASRLR